MSSTLNLFRGLRMFIIMWSGQTLSSLGSSMVGFALIVWVYQQAGTAMSVTVLTACTFLPSIAFSLVGGAIVDRLDKRTVLLVTTLIAAGGTGTVLALSGLGALAIWHVYVVNIAMSFNSAFQSPAGTVATTLLVPREQYARASGLQSFGGAAVSIVAAPLATAILAFSGLPIVLTIDFVSFAVAFVVLAVFVRIPPAPVAEPDEPLVRRVTAGLRFLVEHSPLLRLILTFALVNLLAYVATYALLAPMILARSGGDRTALGLVTAAEGVAALLGSALVMGHGGTFAQVLGLMVGTGPGPAWRCCSLSRVSLGLLSRCWDSIAPHSSTSTTQGQGSFRVGWCGRHEQRTQPTAAQHPPHEVE